MKKEPEKKQEVTWEWAQILKYLDGGYVCRIDKHGDNVTILFQKPGHNFTLDTIQR